MKNRRRKYSIDSAVQGALVRRLMYHWLTFSALCALLLPVWRVINGGNVQGPFTMLVREACIEMIPVFLFMLLLLPMFVWDTIKLSNRFAGPMYRFRGVLRRMAAGENVEPIRLRRGDFWTDVADDINALAERFSSLEEKAAQKDRKDADDAAPSLALAGSANSSRET